MPHLLRRGIQQERMPTSTRMLDEPLPHRDRPHTVSAHSTRPVDLLEPRRRSRFFAWKKHGVCATLTHILRPLRPLAESPKTMTIDRAAEHVPDVRRPVPLQDPLPTKAHTRPGPKFAFTQVVDAMAHHAAPQSLHVRRKSRGGLHNGPHQGDATIQARFVEHDAPRRRPASNAFVDTTSIPPDPRYRRPTSSPTSATKARAQPAAPVRTKATATQCPARRFSR